MCQKTNNILLFSSQNAPTLASFVMRNTKDPELVILMNAIALSCKQIATAVKRAGIAKLYGLHGEQNSTGDDQKMLDVMSNDIMINALKNSGVCSVLVSEEDEEVRNTRGGRRIKIIIHCVPAANIPPSTCAFLSVLHLSPPPAHHCP